MVALVSRRPELVPLLPKYLPVSPRTLQVAAGELRESRATEMQNSFDKKHRSTLQLEEKLLRWSIT
jgi:hypothetical protein